MPRPDSPRPFRSGVSLMTAAPAGGWRAKCRRAEELGYDVILVPDHLGMPAPFPALVAATGATERPWLGTFVLNAGFWNPALLAREATTDARGARHRGPAVGLPGERLDHLRRTIEEVYRLLGSEEHRPQPVKRRAARGPRS